MTRLRQQLRPEDRDRLKLTLVSLDPERDTVPVLKRTVEQRHLDTSYWTLARTDAPSVRKLAAVLGIQYRQLSNKDFNHSTVFVLLDSHGRIRAQSDKLGEVDEPFASALRRLMAE